MARSVEPEIESASRGEPRSVGACAPHRAVPGARYGEQRAGHRPIPERARPLIDLLFDRLADGERINLRVLQRPGARNHFARHVDEAYALAREAVTLPDTDVLLGVLPRQGNDGTAHGSRRGTCLWVDLDAHDDPDGASGAWRRLTGFAIPPSAVVYSGRGLHAYWRLAEDVPLATAAHRERFSLVLRALAHDLGGDPAATDLARVLRLPGSLNWKYRPPRSVSILALTPDQRPRMRDFVEVLATSIRSVSAHAMQRVDAAPTSLAALPRGSTLGAKQASLSQASVPEGERWVARMLIDGAALGRRNAACARLSGYLLSRGLPWDVVRAIVLAFAARCRPPLAANEAERVVRSIGRYRRLAPAHERAPR